MTSPKQAHDSDNGRYYSHPVTGEQLVSVTNVLSTAVAKPALVGWATKITAEKAAASVPTLVASALVAQCKPKRVADECGRCTPCVIKTIKREVTIVREKASDLGTRVHHHADAHVTGKAVEDDEEVTPYLGQYLRFLEDFGVDITKHVEAAELTVANPSIGLAGTLDLIMRLPLSGYLPSEAVPVHPASDSKRGIWLVDIKTSATKPADTVYPEMALQLSALRHMTEMWLPDDTTAPMVRGITGAAVLNLRTDDYALIPLPSGTPEWSAYQGLLKGTKWLHSDPVATARPITPKGKVIPKATRARKTKTTTPGKAA